MRVILWLILLVSFISTFIFRCSSGVLPTREVAVKSTIDLEKLSPKVDTGNILWARNYFAVDNHKNVLFIDPPKHRILKFNKNGIFVRQIGSIGQDEESLYNPVAFVLYKNSIFILNNAGKELKILSEHGEFIQSFKLDNIWLANSLAVDEGRIFIGTRFFDKNDYNKYHPISIFSMSGDMIGGIGELIKCKSFTGYRVFNEVYINTLNKRIYGAYKNRPIIFCYSHDGEEIYFKDMAESDIVEFRTLFLAEIQSGFDTPDSNETETGMKNIVYCNGFGIDSRMHVYYVQNLYRFSGYEQGRSFVLHFDRKGRPRERLSLSVGGSPIMVEAIFIDSGDVRYGIGKADGRPILFQF